MGRVHPGSAATSRGIPRPPKLGRPRASEFEGSGDPGEDILAAAAELISTVGYARATTRAIAAKAGLRQSSMFHYFPSKAHLLAALFERIIGSSVDLVDALDASDLPPGARVYVLAYGDVWNLAASETNIALLQFINEAQGEQFDQFWRDYARLRDAHARYLADGIADGSLAASSVPLAIDLILGVIDSVAMWFVPAEHNAEDVALEVADAVALYVLSDKTQLASVRSAGLSFFKEYRGRHRS